MGRPGERPDRDQLRAQGGDFLVGRWPAGATYQLAVVVDDAAMDLRQVIRGDDLVPSTPRQILLYRALGRAIPAFGHVPLAVGDDGRRLAKRDGSIKLSALRMAGLDPGWLVGWLARSCGWSTGIEPTAPRDWIARADLARLPAGPWVVTSSEVAAMLTGILSIDKL